MSLNVFLLTIIKEKNLFRISLQLIELYYDENFKLTFSLLKSLEFIYMAEKKIK